jgi:hypothetical protein
MMSGVIARILQPASAWSATLSRGVRKLGREDGSNESVGWVGITSDLVVVATLKPGLDRKTCPYGVSESSSPDLARAVAFPCVRPPMRLRGQGESGAMG